MFKVKTKCLAVLRSKLLEGITSLHVHSTLSYKYVYQTIGLIINACTAPELERILNWVLPKLEELIKDRKARYIIANLFQKGKLIILDRFYHMYQ